MAFTVIDFETTGFSPERNDRVIEIGVVLVDDFGQIEQEWTTLVNPQRDVGATHIHGLQTRDLLDAPEFCDVADQILIFLGGRTVVAHNASFDMRFLRSELCRAGYSIPGLPPALCSMKWSGRLVGPAKLQHVCEALGVQLENAHSAIGDARATAGLLARLMSLAKFDKEWSEDSDRSRKHSWPPLRGKLCAAPIARGEWKSNTRSWLDCVLGAAWVPGVPEDEASYMLVLDQALLDRDISASEGRQLAETAKSARLSGAKIAGIHRSYLQSVVQESLADGAITDEERADIFAVAGALGLAKSDVEEFIAEAAYTQTNRKVGGSFSLGRGDRVVFTGETSRPREVWIKEIVDAGLTSGGVAKSTRLVVAADPDSLSGKAVKAREYGIPIVDEKAFDRLFQRYRETIGASQRE